MQNICYESTSNCVLACPYCISKDNGVMKYDNHKEVIDFIGRLHPDRVVISGGEPLIDPLLKNKIQMIIDKYNEQGLKPYISLSTSGACDVSEDMWSFLKDNIQCFDISIPTLNYDVYESMRGKNLLDKALINAKNAVVHGLNVRVSIIMTKENKKELPNILKFAERIGVNSVRVGRYFPFRTANDVKDDYELEEVEIQEIIDDINSGKYSEIFTKKILPPIKSLDMMSGYLNVNFNGDVFIPNKDGKKIIGNVSDIDVNDLDDLFNDSQKKIFIKSKEQ